jgi:hypothetical protein
MASFIARRRSLGYGHSQGVGVDLAGTSTNWGASTTFTLSGVAGASIKGGPIVNSTTSARIVVVTPAATAGTGPATLTITDGGTGGTGATATVTVKRLHRTKWFPSLV